MLTYGNRYNIDKENNTERMTVLITLHISRTYSFCLFYGLSRDAYLETISVFVMHYIHT